MRRLSTHQLFSNHYSFLSSGFCTKCTWGRDQPCWRALRAPAVCSRLVCRWRASANSRVIGWLDVPGGSCWIVVCGEFAAHVVNFWLPKPLTAPTQNRLSKDTNAEENWPHVTSCKCFRERPLPRDPTNSLRSAISRSDLRSQIYVCSQLQTLLPRSVSSLFVPG